jgi:hypothetical protein
MIRRRSTDQYQRALAALCQTAFLEIRASAHLRQVSSASGVELGNGDYLEHIRAVADVCHNLPGGPPSEADARRRLAYLWETASEQQRGWIRATLTWGSIDADRLIGAAGDAP